MATFTVTIELEDTDDHENAGAVAKAIENIQVITIDIDTTLASTPIDQLIKRAIASNRTTGGIYDNSKQIGCYWNESH